MADGAVGSRAKRFAEAVAEALDDFADARDVVVLARDEGDERLEEVLAQDADAGREGHAAGERRVGRVGLPDCAVVDVEREIVPPEGAVRLLRPLGADDQRAVADGCRGEDAAHDAGEGAVAVVAPAEGLAAAERFGQGERFAAEADAEKAHKCIPPVTGRLAPVM